jgi:hypothetical protein
MSDSIEASLEVLAPSALESIERASIDVQVSTAHKFPRSIELFRRRAMDIVQQDLSTAESCIYSRPVGKGPDGKQKYAEGASVRMAEIVASCYGNIRFGARIVEQTERYVKAEGLAHDLETNCAAKSEAMESTLKRDGKPYDERMRIVVAKACLSKALRDAIFRVVPRAMCKSIYDAAVATINKQAKTIDQRIAAVKQWLDQIKVNDARVFAVLEIKGWSEVGNDQLITLTGLRTGIKDNEITIDEAFPPIAQAAKTTAPAAPVPPTPATTTTQPPPAATEPPVASASEGAATPASPAGEVRHDLTAKSKAESLGLTEPQCLRYLQSLRPPMARSTNKSLAELSDAKLVSFIAALDDPAIVEDIKKIVIQSHE